MDNKNRIVGSDTKITNIMLGEAISRMKADDTPENRNVVIDETVMNATFLMPVAVVNGTVQFKMVTNSDDDNYFLAFTDWEEMKTCISGPDQKAMIMTFNDYAMLMKKNNQTAGFVINPFSTNLIFNKEYILELFEKKLEILTGKDN